MAKKVLYLQKGKPLISEEIYSDNSWRQSLGPKLRDGYSEQRANQLKLDGAISASPSQVDRKVPDSRNVSEVIICSCYFTVRRAEPTRGCLWPGSHYTPGCHSNSHLICYTAPHKLLPNWLEREEYGKDPRQSKIPGLLDARVKSRRLSSHPTEGRYVRPTMATCCACCGSVTAEPGTLFYGRGKRTFYLSLKV